MGMLATMVHVGSRLKKIMEEHQLTAEQFADKLGVSREHIQRTFGREEVPIKLLKKVCEIFNYTISDLTSESWSVKEPGAEYGLKKEVELLRQMLKDKERIIELLTNKNKKE